MNIYEEIFVKNISEIMKERKLTKLELSKSSGVSISFISDLTNGKANPSLRVMSEIALALDVALPELFCPNNLDKTNHRLIQKFNLGIPDGFERVSGVLPAHKAFLLKKWMREAKEYIADKELEVSKTRSHT